MSEVLALIAYNWPGNVREIDRIARLMLRHKMESERLFPIPIRSSRAPSDAQPENFDFNSLRAALDDSADQSGTSDAEAKTVMSPEHGMKIIDKMQHDYESLRLKILDERYSFLDSSVGDDILQHVGSWDSLLQGRALGSIQTGRRHPVYGVVPDSDQLRVEPGAVREGGLLMKQHKCQTTKHQYPSRKGGDIGRKERMNSQVLTVCFTKGICV
jgi:hypothetical protein